MESHMKLRYSRRHLTSEARLSSNLSRADNAFIKAITDDAIAGFKHNPPASPWFTIEDIEAVVGRSIHDYVISKYGYPSDLTGDEKRAYSPWKDYRDRIFNLTNAILGRITAAGFGPAVI